MLLRKSQLSYYSYAYLTTPKLLLKSSIRNLDVSGNQDIRIRVNRKPTAVSHQQTQRPTSIASPTSPPLRGKEALIKIASYDKERESTLNNIQHGDILLQSPGMSKHI